MSADGLSLSELANAAGCDVRRVRHWTIQGALQPIGRTHAGTGQHRRYAADVAYTAAILDFLANRGLPIGVLKDVAVQLPDLRKPPAKERLWGDAISGARPVFLLIVAVAPKDMPNETFTGMRLLTADETLKDLLNRAGGILINLTRIFEGVTTA